MDIRFCTKKLRKRCNSLKEAQKKWGTSCGNKILQRLEEIRSSENLADLMLIHRRCHSLKGKRKGQWSVDVEHPYRLLFTPANNPLPILDNGELDIKQITAIEVLGIEDTHG